MATQLWSVIVIIASTVLSSFGSFYMKVGSKSFVPKIQTLVTNMPLVGGLTFHVLSGILGVIAYSGGELTVLVPLGSLNYIWASILAVYFLDEKMNRWKWLGILFIMVGVTLIGLGESV
jgi:uncharacterized membrane protein